LSFFVAVTKNSGKERNADGFNCVETLRHEVKSDFFEFGIFWPSTKGNLQKSVKKNTIRRPMTRGSRHTL
jgi:hypothetical protein